ncbi:MFS transporter [Subtercola frigoramans]|uniref:MFS family permease n=1 Tax=Subtercola frigoramans TaxID=120298 RepID=A0ABS2L8S9_9MICO|nr:MFS transporter [Subtercola frigoramans]MBM7473505.1 MFS family permease [Subtercola frigoramans]
MSTGTPSGVISTSSTASTRSSARSTQAPRTRRRLSHSVGFWVIAFAFLTVMAFSTVPTPLYSLYQQRDGFATFLITVIFAAYAIGVMLSLYLAGHVSDWLGRRPVILVAVLLQIVAAVLFLFWSDVAGLIVARLISGLGVGVLTATATAHLSELRSAARADGTPGSAPTVAGIANIGGIGLGALVSGAIAQFVATPLVVPYVVFLILLVIAALGVVLVPETVVIAAERPAYRPQRISLPAESRPVFSAAAVAAFGAFSIFGLFTSLAPAFVSGILNVSGHLTAGAVVFSVFASAATAQVVFARVSARRQLILAVILMVAGLVVLAAGVLAPSFALFVVGGIIAGAGVGILFRGAVGVAARLAPAEHRGEVLAGLFLVAYAGLAVPVLGIGIAVAFAPMQPVLVTFAGIIVVLVLWSGRRMIVNSVR